MLFPRRSYDQDHDLLLYIHVPKTAGQSLVAQLRAVLREGSQSDRRAGIRHLTNLENEMLETEAARAARQFAQARAYKTYEDRQGFRRRLGLPNSSIRTARFAYGHIALYQVDLRGRSALPIVVLRDPVARIISQFRYEGEKYRKGQGKTPDARRTLAAEGDLQGYVEAWIEAGASQNINHQCLYLAEEGTFEVAKRVVDEQIWIAGVTENYARFVEVLSGATGLVLGAPQRKNVGPQGDAAEDLPAHLRAKLEGLISEDLRLHDYVAREFERVSK